MKLFQRLFVFALLLPVAFTSHAQESTTVLMTFMPNIQYAPVYLAIENGNFADAGFEVSLQYLDEPVIVDLVATSEYQFAVVSGEQVIISAADSRPVVYVYEWYQQYPIGLVYSSALEVEDLSDLTNMRAGIPGRFGANYIALGAFLTASGMSENDIAIQEIGFVAPDVFCSGEVDAAVVYSNNEPLQIRNRADAGDCGEITEVSVLPVSSAIDLISNGLVTNQESVANDPDTVRAFVAAYDAALRLTINNPARAYLLSVPYIEGLPLTDAFQTALESAADEQDTFLEDEPSREEIAASRLSMYESLAEAFSAEELLQFEILLSSIALWDAERLGYTDGHSWENMQETLLNLGYLRSTVELESLYTNEFLPEEADD